MGGTDLGCGIGNLVFDKGPLTDEKRDEALRDHGADFAAKNAVDYVKKAKEFLTSPPAGTLTGARPNGDIVRFNPASDAFGIAKSDGVPKTYFKPDPAINGYDTNLDYFHAEF